MCGKSVVRSTMSSKSKNRAPGICATWYSCHGSLLSSGMYQEASNTLIPGCPKC
uniref:Uncharacterized protein n=1 Tax=Arundo donax TaxID=35708 RepID=A0A0A9EU55_ARUDO